MREAGMPIGALLGTLNPSCPNPKTKRENNLIFIFTLLCGGSKSFIKAFNPFIKPFEIPQGSAEIKI